MVSLGRDRKPAVAASASKRGLGTTGSLFRFRSPGVFAGGTAAHPSAYLLGRHGVGGLDGSGGGVVGKAMRWVWRLFPERQILVRAEGRVSYLTLSRRAQLVMAVIVIAGSGFVAYTTTHTFRLKPHQGELAQSTPSDAELLARIETLRHQLDEVNAQLAQASAAPKSQESTSVEDAQARIGALEAARDRAIAEQHELRRQLEAAQEAASAKSQNLAQLNRTLDANRGELRQSDAQRANLQSRVRQLESELENANARTNQYKSELASNERRLQQLAAEHERTVAERDRLQARLTETQSRGPTLNLAPPSDVGALPPASQRSQLERAPEQRSDNAA